jgi:hypothetical protein
MISRSSVSVDVLAIAAIIVPAVAATNSLGQ